MTNWTPQQVKALAPDARSAQAARALATPRRWSDLGTDGTAVWGRCRGTDPVPYETAVDLATPAFRCSCPSRKTPCKHALGLLTLWASAPEAVPPGARLSWVGEWEEARRLRPGRLRAGEQTGLEAGAQAMDRQRAEGRPGQPVGEPPGEPEEQAAARAAARAARAAGRAARMGSGLEELDRWLGDLVRQGLAAAASQPFRLWDTVAARMVDAQAPGAASRVRRMAATIYGGARGLDGDEGWPGRVLDQAGRLHLLTAAWPRLDQLSPDTQADLRSQLGWARSTDEVRAGPSWRDWWQVVGEEVSDEERFQARRTWLWGRASRRPALLLEFAPSGLDFVTDLAPGTSVDADLAFYPGSVPLRAVLVVRHGDDEGPVQATGWGGVEAGLATYADALARNPWIERFPMALASVVPYRRGERWMVRDDENRVLPLELGDGPGDERAWRLVAVSGGHPLGLFGEWGPGGLRPLSALADGRLVAL